MIDTGIGMGPEPFTLRLEQIVLPSNVPAGLSPWLLFAISAANTHITPEGHRRCRACMEWHGKRYRERDRSGGILSMEA